jgi:hypothetical protein
MRYALDNVGQRCLEGVEKRKDPFLQLGRRILSLLRGKMALPPGVREVVDRESCSIIARAWRRCSRVPLKGSDA